MIDLEAKLEDFYPIPEGNEQYAFEFIETHRAIKLQETDSELSVGITIETPTHSRDIIRNYHQGKKIIFKLIDQVSLSAHLGKRVSESLNHAPTSDQSTHTRIILDRMANDAPIINLVNSICIDGIRLGASDIHIEALEANVRIRYRIDGVLQTVRLIDKQHFSAISSRIKIMGNLNIMETRLPQDGRISVDIGGDTVDLRVSIIPVAYGESIVLRLFNKSGNPLTLDQLGFSTSQIQDIRKMLKIPHGLILVTGPTGSGKTTTLNAMLREIVSDNLKIVTIEDPIEYLLDGVNQVQTNEQIELTFDSLLKRVLRQDPNVIMVGEIRDMQTAELAVRASLTGHLVLSTLHTNTVVSVIPRLRNMGIPSYLIASVLQGAIAQRLVRRTCTHCRAPRNLTPIEKGIYKTYGLHTEYAYEGHGCEECGNSGYSSRSVIAELFSMSIGLEELILKDENSTVIEKHLMAGGMKSLAQDALRKVAAGETSIKEVEREVSL